MDIWHEIFTSMTWANNIVANQGRVMIVSDNIVKKSGKLTFTLEGGTNISIAVVVWTNDTINTSLSKAEEATSKAVMFRDSTIRLQQDVVLTSDTIKMYHNSNIEPRLLLRIFIDNDIKNKGMTVIKLGNRTVQIGDPKFTISVSGALPGTSNVKVLDYK